MNEPAVDLARVRMLRDIDRALAILSEGQGDIEILAAAIDELSEEQLRRVAYKLGTSAMEATKMAMVSLETFKNALGASTGETDGR